MLRISLDSNGTLEEKEWGGRGGVKINTCTKQLLLIGGGKRKAHRTNLFNKKQYVVKKQTNLTTLYDQVLTFRLQITLFVCIAFSVLFKACYFSHKV